MNSILEKHNEVVGESSIGQMVWWTLRAERWNTELLKDGMENYGLDSDSLVRESNKANFIDAVKTIAKEVGCDVKKVNDDAKDITFRVIDCTVDKTERKVKFDQHTLVTFNKEKNIIMGDGNMELVSEIALKFSVYQQTTPYGKVRSTITNILKEDGYAVNLRDSGGVYFIPKNRTHVVKNLSDWVQTLGLGFISPTDIQGSEISRDSIMQGTVEDFDGRLQAILKDVENVGSRISALNKAQDKVDAIEELCNHYVEAMERVEMATTVYDACEELTNTITNKITELEIAKAKKDK